MVEVIKVICSKNGSRVCSESFRDIDSAFEFANKKTETEGCVSLILQLDFQTAKWKRRITLYPSDC